MPAPTGLSPLLHSAGIALGLLLVAALLTHREGNRVANRWLAAFVACLALLWLNDLLEETDIWLRFTWTQNAFDWLLLVFGPCLWIYVRRLTLHDEPRGWALLPHAIPALLLIALLMQVYLAPEEQKRALTLADRAQRATRGPDWILFACALQVMAYWIASLRVLQRFGARLKENHSSIGERSFDWLRTLLMVILAVWVVWVTGILLHSPWADVLVNTVIPACLYVLAYFGLRQPAVFVEQPAAEAPTGKRRYERSGLDDARVPQLLARLDALMRSEKPWLENDLTLGQLAERSELTPHNLSQLLNAGLGLSFFDYINAQRVAEVRRCLEDPAYDGQTVLQIALDSGFSSKTAFNVTFRQQTGETPSDYRRRVRNGRGSAPA